MGPTETTASSQPDPSPPSIPKPSKGRIVLVKMREMGRPVYDNGISEHPAIVTADYANHVINVRVFLDRDEPLPWLTSIPHDYMTDPEYGGSTWRWPDRV